MKTKLLLTVGSAALIIAVAAIAVPAARQRAQYRLQIKTYFRDANGLKAGARVALAGVKVGEVETVRARPELKDSPAEVVMNLRTDYVLNIPSDAVVALSSAGILGETFAAIDVSNTSGAPINNGAVLKSAPMQTLSSQELLDRLSEVLKSKGCRTGPVAAETSQHPTSLQKRK
jgi:phospholipid/cholesterol/gamma-HCH transport system substrate-binding protein